MRNNNLKNVIRYQFRWNGPAVLWLVIILILINAVWAISIGRILGPWEFHFQYELLASATQIFMLVIGLFAVGTSLSFLVAQGVTRKTFLQGTLIALSAASLGLAVLYNLADALILGTELSTMLLRILTDTELFILYYLAGWLINLCFYQYGVIPGLLSIPAAAGILLGGEGILGPGAQVRLESPAAGENWIGIQYSVSDIRQFFILIALLAVCGILLSLLTLRVRVKVK